ncbi:uncharacterized protein LOC124493256 isoform X1 [Dermatophagoides farinae]|uniref:uncharacterized protein LOC124493256 isoform X1 n=1 Tax=Dermatophagoides farinae TaxID=6954 RepID=UPI003F5ED5C0
MRHSRIFSFIANLTNAPNIIIIIIKFIDFSNFMDVKTIKQNHRQITNNNNKDNMNINYRFETIRFHHHHHHHHIFHIIFIIIIIFYFSFSNILVMATIPEYNHHNHIHYSSSSSSSSKSLLNTTNSLTTTTTITPSHHTISHHRQQCENSSDCDSNLICHNHTCLCSLGQINHYEMNSKPYRPILKLSSNNNNKMTQQSTVPILSRRPQYFRLGTSCQKKSEKLDCPAEYSYCFERKCQCWPEFEFWEDPEFSLSNAENNSGVSSLQLITKELLKIASEHVDVLGESDWNDGMKIGKCLRKICDTDDDCRSNNNGAVTGRNSNLVCNNTVCECAYGYAIHRDTHVCVKLLLRRPSCDLTCKIIGSLFASIFVLTLIYWCFYCCVAIVKNFHHHHHHHHQHHHNQHNRRQTQMDETDIILNLINRRQSLSNSIASFLTKMDKPPTYDEVMSDDDCVNTSQSSSSASSSIQRPQYIEMKEILPRYCSLWKLESNLNNPSSQQQQQQQQNNEEYEIINCQNPNDNDDDDNDGQ